jgi:hypothetical protein
MSFLNERTNNDQESRAVIKKRRPTNRRGDDNELSIFRSVFNVVVHVSEVKCSVHEVQRRWLSKYKLSVYFFETKRTIMYLEDMKGENQRQRTQRLKEILIQMSYR